MKIIPFLFVIGLCVWGRPVLGEEKPTTTPGEIHLYYFHRTGRCPTCLGMEKWTKEIAESLAAAHPARPILMDVVNLDLPENAHFEKDFQLTFSTVVMAEHLGQPTARWKNLEDIWTYSSDEAAFRTYITNAFSHFLTASD